MNARHPLPRKVLAPLLLLQAACLLVTFAAWAGPSENQAPETGTADAKDLEQIRNRYWAQGSENEMGVVQNRTYTKQGKVETWLMGGLVASDPFLSIKSLGLSVGYHFNEQYSMSAFGFRDWVSPSSALETLEGGGKKANTNPPRGTVGGQFKASLLYGKLSLLGRKILYYDMHTGLGAHATSTETGTYLGPVFSIGQSVYINRRMAFRVDYQLNVYSENIIEKEKTLALGQVMGSRTNFSNSIQIGLSLLWGGGQEQ